MNTAQAILWWLLKPLLKNPRATLIMMLKRFYYVRDSFINYCTDLNKLLFTVSCLPFSKINNPIKDPLSFKIFIMQLTAISFFFNSVTLV